ncbi:hypothetical protein [Stenotrophomonas sp.]|uniref:hypothetical protein n=1 Tax=Stenotrophomonas sp. TaxID=69392 RepID=UPI0028ADACCF|nr:hypothetical protein [Stenotrophomonas sp.]
MEDNSPYQASSVAPVAPPSGRLDWRDEAPREITSPIKHMAILLAVAGVLALIASVVPFFGSRSLEPMLMALALGLTSIYLLLAYGVYKRSRVVASVVLAFWCLSALGTLLKIVGGQGGLTGIGFTVIFGFVSIRGTLATFRYHRHLANVRIRPARTRLSDDPAFAPKIDTAL